MWKWIGISLIMSAIMVGSVILMREYAKRIDFLEKGDVGKIIELKDVICS